MLCQSTYKYLSSFLSFTLTFTVRTYHFTQRHGGKIKKEICRFLPLSQDFLKLFGIPLKTTAVVYILDIYHWCGGWNTNCTPYSLPF